MSWILMQRLTEWWSDTSFALGGAVEFGGLMGGVPAAYLGADRVERRVSRRLPVHLYRRQAL